MDIAGASLGIDRREGLAQERTHHFEQGIKRDFIAGGHVDHPATGGPAPAQIHLDHIRDKNEIARLFAVTENGRPFGARQALGNNGDRAGIRRRRILARTEHIEITQAYRLQTIKSRIDWQAYSEASLSTT